MMKKILDIKFNWKSKKSIPVYILMFYFLFIVITYMNQDLQQEVQNPSLRILVILWFVVSLLSMIEITSIRGFMKRYAKWINGLVLILSPITSFLTVEIMVSNFNPDMFKAYSLYNLIWYYIIYYLFYALIRNSKVTIILSNFLIYIAAMVNYFVFLFRGNPILPSDLLAWQTGMSVASNYDISYTLGFLIATLIMIVIFLLGYRLENTDKKMSITNRIVGLGIYALFATAVFIAFFQTNLIETKIRVLDFFAPKYTYCSYGTAFGFVANVQAMETDCPEGYLVEQVEALYDNMQTDTEETDVKETDTKETDTKETDNKETDTKENDTTKGQPNIIAIMNEAFSDLSMLGEFNTNMDYFPNIDKLEQNTTKGTLYVSVFGGATSDTEYEFLTGNSMAVMPQNCVPYQQFITEPTDSLARVLKDQGYYNIAIHPYEPSGYKRDLVYPLLGFDEFLSMEDFEEPHLIRSYISDRESYQKIIEQYESKGAQSPLFIFNVTMQNHGGYSGGKVFDEEETVRFTELVGYTKVEQYLSLLRESDKAFQTLVDYFSKEEEPTIILLFGDHQPVVYSEFHDRLAEQKNLSYAEIYQRKYMVPFILWANYDITEDDVDKISANYLSSYLLQTAGLKETQYNNYLMKLQHEIPVINALFYIDKENALHKFSDLTTYSDLIMEYRYVGYNNAFDKKDRLDEFFRLNK